MSSNELQRIRRLHEIASSVNLALTLVAFFFLGTNSATSALFEMDRAIYRHFGRWVGVRVAKDHFTMGYFAFFLPAIALAVVVWLVLRLSARTRSIKEILQFVAGVAALVGPPAWWFCAVYRAGNRYESNPFEEVQFYEVLLILVFGIAYSYRKPVPAWVAIVIIASHYGFWFLQFGDRLYFMGYGGPVAPTVGLCASLTWVLYMRQLRRLEGAA